MNTRTVRTVLFAITATLNATGMVRQVTAQRLIPLRVQRTFHFDATTDRPTAELKASALLATKRSKAGLDRQRVTNRIATTPNSFAQTTIRDRAIRNGSRNDFHRDVNRIESQAQAVYGGWYWNAEWLPRVGRWLRMPMFWK